LGFEGFGDLRVQLLPGIAQETAVRHVPHQRVLERVDCVRRRAALEHQLRCDKVGESDRQPIFRKV